MKRSQVVHIKNDQIRNGGKIQLSELFRIMDAGLENLFPGQKSESIWRSLFSPSQTIAIKVNCLAGRGLSTHPELVQVILSKLIAAGISKQNIVVFDRADGDLVRAGFKINRNKSAGIRCAGNDSLGYHPDLLIYKSIGSMISSVMHEADVIINVPVLKDHGIVGMSGALKNFFGVIHNPNKYHLNIGDPYVADLCSYPLIKDKVRLTIVDAITAQYEAGPPFIPQYAVHDNSLILGQDMVAIDRIGWKLIDEWRKQDNIPSLKEAGREPHYILTASDEEHKVGEANISNIDYKKTRLL